MALIFELWAECEGPEAAKRFAGHFHGRNDALLSGKVVHWLGETEGDRALGASVWSRDLGNRGPRTVQDALDFTEAGIRLFHRLLSAPAFRFAHVAIGALNVVLDDLQDHVQRYEPGENRLEMECVIDEGLWEELGRPRNTRPFRPGHCWRPWTGVRYSPLASTDHPEFRRLCEELWPSEPAAS